MEPKCLARGLIFQLLFQVESIYYSSGQLDARLCCRMKLSGKQVRCGWCLPFCTLPLFLSLAQYIVLLAGTDTSILKLWRKGQENQRPHFWHSWTSEPTTYLQISNYSRKISFFFFFNPLFFVFIFVFSDTKFDHFLSNAFPLHFFFS